MKTNRKLVTKLFLAILMLCSFQSFSQTIYAEERGVYDEIKVIEIKGTFCDVEISGTERKNLQFIML